jgi:hypothetical protein
MNGRPWTDAELATLRRLYPHHTAAHIGQQLGRAQGSVHAKAAALGLHKSAEFLASTRSGRIQRGRKDPRMQATQFKPGLTPWNKGKHFVSGGRSAQTRFKKGQMSGAAQHNYVPIGSYRISKDGYLERKVTDDPSLYPARRWVPVARLVWEQHHGPIPAGHIVIFRPGQFTNRLEQITPERLECITRAENARRNHPRNKHPEYARLVQIKGQITRQANRIAKEAHEAREAATA